MEIPKVDLSKFDEPSNIQQGGIIIRVGKKYELVRVRNAHPRPHKNFRRPNASIDDLLTTPVDAIIGFAHTHLEDQSHMPSSRDIASIPSGKLGVVYHPVRGSAVWYTNKGVLRRGYRQTR